ncbi:hypothetical protein FKB36_00185 [Methanoculleus sp. Afa-1]|jgi:hypothetical protein|uniref:Antitoxin n=1 Tax=Methanoculleus formosensis TaxID=2590886 RepID=A0A9E5DD21_9EURY|nr:hypothetical protein [Methanoculleus sp. Afa-1]MCT8335954.1 hypothetical protein [Methanoculleus sp. Afa-1]
MTIDIKRQYIVADDRRIGVVLDIETFEKIEELLENCGLARYMEEVEKEETLSLNEARQYYAQMSEE